MDSKTINRRRFLRLGCIALGAGAVTCAGVGVIGARLVNQVTSEENPGAPVEPAVFPDVTFGEDVMTNAKKILVAYASQAGSTGGVAEAIGKTLAEGGATVDVRPVKDVASLEEYGAVVLGSAIHGGKWMPEAAEFLRGNQAKLNQVPTAFFLVSMMAAKGDESNRKFVAQFLEAERGLVKPVAEGRFGGAISLDKYSFGDALGLRVFLAYLRMRPGDYRDWDAIRAWTEETRGLLM